MPKITDISTENLADADFLFNGSIFRHDDQLYIAYRANNTLIDARIYINKLNPATYQPEGEPILVDIPNVTASPIAAFEDPRVFTYNGRLYCSFVFLRLGYSAQAQGLVRLDKNFKVVSTSFIKYGYNHNQAIFDPVKRMDDRGIIHTVNPGNIFEKNWQFFAHGKKAMFVYSFTNHTVVEADLPRELGVKEHKSAKVMKWDYGEIRGGTPPVRVGDHYISFFHSSKQEKPKEKVYHMGAYTFSAKAPFEPLQITKKPLLSGDKKDKNRGLWNNIVVFPCGSVKIKNKWLVSYGHNDYSLKLFEIAHEELEQKLTNI